MTGIGPGGVARRPSRTAVGALVLGVVVLGAVSVFAVVDLSATPATDRHADGAGPLASRNGAGSETMAVDPTATSATTWTFGLRLCAAEPGASIVLRSVEPTNPVGSGFRFLGAGVRAFQPGPGHTSIIGVDGYPPPPTFVPDAVAAVAGFGVRTACTDDPAAPYTELLIGLGRTSGDGGGWKGVDVAYVSGGRTHVLAIDHNLLICGAAVASFCVIPGGSNPSAGATQ